MEYVRTLLLEENVKDYLSVRQRLDEQTNRLAISWAPNFDTAYRLIKQNTYDIFLITYTSNSKNQHKFLTWLYTHINDPIILLTESEIPVEAIYLDKYKTDYMQKSSLTWSQLEHSILCLSTLIESHQAEQKYQTVFENAHEFMGLVKPNGTIIEINQTALSLSSSHPDELIGRPLWETPWAYHAPHTQAEFKAAVATAARGEVISYEIEISNHAGETVTLDFVLTPILDSNGDVKVLLAEGHNLSDRKHIEEQLRHATLHDPLTNLPNSHLFIEYLERALERAETEGNYQLAVIFLDIDRFKLINASLGHDMGDWLLMEIAQRIDSCLKKGTILARSGGDEFLILLENILNLTEATELADKINHELGQIFLLDGYEVVTSASIGIAYCDEKECSTDLLRDADTAMYRAKAMGRSCAAVFHSKMHNQALSRLEIETDLYRGIEQDDFILFFQPQIDLHTEELMGMEALIRFNHPTKGLISPAHFIPILEDTGIILEIGEWIINRACRQFKQFLSEGLNLKRISVNLSAHQFRNHHLPDIVADALRDTQMSSECLELELTESLLLEDTATTTAILKQFKDMGIRVTIDDFGTGYASFSYLKRFPVDCLKIDKSFIHGIITCPEDAAITVATIDMAHALGLEVIAEGVETIDQLEFLRDHGCDYTQGFLYSPPLEYFDFLEWTRKYTQMMEHNQLLNK